jgi:membrane protease YdiL (CAAX protease family)
LTPTFNPPEAHGPEARPAVTHPVRSRVPRWGSVARPGTGRSGLSTAPRLSAAPGATGAGAWVGGVVLAGGLAFLLLRPALGGVAFAVPLLAVGYLALAAGALVAGASERAGARNGRAPLGWAPVLAVGGGAVGGGGGGGGPAPGRRVGVAAALLAVLAAVSEEALFRGLLYGRLERSGPVVAVAGSAVVFALVHLPGYGVAAMPVDLGAGLLLSWQRYACGRWTVPAVTHVVANLLAVT